MEPSTWTALISAFIGMIVGAIPGTIASWIKSSTQKRESYNLALFALLEIRFWASRAYPKNADEHVEAASKEVVNIIKTKYYGVTDEDGDEIKNHLLPMLAEAVKFKASQIDEQTTIRLSESLQQAVSLLSKHDPTSAYLISSEDKIINLIEDRHQYAQHMEKLIQNTMDASEIGNLDIRKCVANELTDDLFRNLDQQISEIASLCSRRTQRRLIDDIGEIRNRPFHLSESDRISIEDLLDSLFEQAGIIPASPDLKEAT